MLRCVDIDAALQTMTMTFNASALSCTLICKTFSISNIHTHARVITEQTFLFTSIQPLVLDNPTKAMYLDDPTRARQAYTLTWTQPPTPWPWPSARRWYHAAPQAKPPCSGWAWAAPEKATGRWPLQKPKAIPIPARGSSQHLTRPVKYWTSQLWNGSNEISNLYLKPI